MLKRKQIVLIVFSYIKTKSLEQSVR